MRVAIDSAECDDRDRRRSARRIKAAGFPRQKRLIDFDANPSISSEMINTLATCGWIRNGEPLCLVGDSGAGKSHLLTGLGAAAAMTGLRVRYVLAAKLVNELSEPPTTRSSIRPSPATAASISSASTYIDVVTMSRVSVAGLVRRRFEAQSSA